MDPYQQPGSPQGNPYDFILNPAPPPKSKKLGSIGGNKFLLTIVMLVGGAFLLMIIVALLLNALAPKKINEAELIGLAQSQQELIRVSTQGARGAVQQTTKDLATTVEYTMLTQEKQTLTVLTRNGTKVGDKQLTLKQKAETDQKLATAKSTSTFDTTFTGLLEDSLNDYANELKQLSALGGSTAERNRLADYYQQTQLLLSRIPYAQERINAGH